MMECIAVALFCTSLLFCLLFNVSILYALVTGWLIFSVYAYLKRYTLQQILGFSFSGIKKASDILVTFFIIGMLTAVWRQSGTIPVLVCAATKLMRPATFLLMTFLLNCCISFLTGTAFGTAATMGVICSTVGMSLSVSPILIGGSVLSGVYFGDRCSPISTSALLVSTITKTNIFNNIKKMNRTALVPFLLTCCIYFLIGLATGTEGKIPDFTAIFGGEFYMSAWTVVPALILLVLSLCKVNVKLSMGISILASVFVCVWIQHVSLSAMCSAMLTGFTATNSEVGKILNGGGLISMIQVAATVCISSAYSGIFEGTELLKSIRTAILKLSEKTTPFTAILLTSVLTGIVACNQTLTIMLTNQLTDGLESNRERFAVDLENSSVVVAPLIPWSIAGAVPLSAVEAPVKSVLFACFLYLLPMCEIVSSMYQKKIHLHFTKN